MYKRMADMIKLLISAILLLSTSYLPSYAQGTNFEDVLSKDIIIYLDESISIVTGDPESPHQKIGRMVQELVSEENFIGQQDRIYFYKFSENLDETGIVNPLYKRNLAAINNYLDEYKKQRKGHTKTDLLKVLDHMKGLALEDPNKYKIFVIASDFMHDPDNYPCNAIKEKGLGNFRTMTTNSIDSIKTEVGSRFTSDKEIKRFLFMFYVKPGYKKWMDECKNIISENERIVLRKFKDDLNAREINYTQVSNDTKVLLREIQETITKRVIIFREDLYVDHDQSKANTFTISVRNPNSWSISIDRIKLKFLGDNLQHIKELTPNEILKPKARHKFNYEFDSELNESVVDNKGFLFSLSQSPNSLNEEEVFTLYEISKTKIKIDNIGYKRVVFKDARLEYTADIDIENGSRDDYEIVANLYSDPNKDRIVQGERIENTNRYQFKDVKLERVKDPGMSRHIIVEATLKDKNKAGKIKHQGEIVNHSFVENYIYLMPMLILLATLVFCSVIKKVISKQMGFTESLPICSLITLGLIFISILVYEWWRPEELFFTLKILIVAIMTVGMCILANAFLTILPYFRRDANYYHEYFPEDDPNNHAMRMFITKGALCFVIGLVSLLFLARYYFFILI